MLREATCFEHIYIRCGYVDLRRGIDGLAEYIRNDMPMDPYAENTLYLFCGRRTDRIKGLTYEKDGFILLYKRIADGHFRWPRTPSEVRELTDEQFHMLTDGYSIDRSINIFKPKLL